MVASLPVVFVCPGSSAGLWYGVGRAGAFTRLLLGMVALWWRELKWLHSPQSGLLLWCCLSKRQQWPLLPHLDHTPGPQGTSASLDSLFPGPGFPRSSARPWCGVSGAGAFAQLRLGIAARRLLLGQTSPPCLLAGW